ncbi:MAG: S8 family serine peptidase [Gammaproteobacteria bacterium]
MSGFIQQYSVSRLIVLLVFLVFTLAACGGGGGGSDPDPNPPQTGGSFSISGKVSTPNYIQSDGDVNDPNAQVRENNSFSQAQKLLNPVTISGYTNISGEGKDGPLFQNGDISDIYRVSLRAGQTISLVIPHHELGDMDLYSYPASCTNTTCSSNRCARDGDPEGNSGGSFESAGANEKITISETGDYFIEVCAWEGFGNYTLTVGGKPAQNAFSAEDDFVPGDIIARFKKPSIGASSLKTSTAIASNDRAVLLKLNDSGSLDLLASSPGNIPQSAIRVAASHSSIQTKRSIAAAKGAEYLKRWDTLNMIAQLNLREDVIFAEPNYRVHASQVPNDELYRLQWHYPLIDLPAAWDITTGSSNVIVAIIDTGIKAGHPDFQGQLTDGYDFISNSTLAADGDGIDADPNDTGPTSPGGGTGHHGTHVAGTVAARSNDGGEGVAGVSWQTKIMPLRVLNGDGSGNSFDILQAVRYAAGLQNDSGSVPARKADIINLSLGGGSFSQEAQDVFTQAYNNGVVIVAAAGNENTATLSYPASYDNVISVSAVDINKEITDYSNYGTQVDVAAPGGSSTDTNGDGYPDRVASLGYDKPNGEDIYVLKAGTSMASPHIAGVFALMKSVNPALTPNDFDTLLAAGDLTEDIGNTGRDDFYGHGLINALKAVNAAGNSGGTPPAPTTQLTVTPSSVNFALTDTSATLTLSSVSGGVTINGLVSEQPYLTASPQTVDASGLGIYQLTLNRNALADGIYTVNLQVQSNLDSITIPVVFQVGSPVTSPGLQPEAGYLYITLFDPDTLDNKFQLELTANPQGVYTYSFTGVPAGDYLLVAGSDFDNNDAICDFSESCGVYPRRDSLNSVITINGNRSNIDFLVDYEIGLRTNALSTANPTATSFANKRPFSRTVR